MEHSLIVLGVLKKGGRLALGFYTKRHRLHRPTHDLKNVLSFSRECLQNTLLDYIVFFPHTSKHIKKNVDTALE